MNLRNRFLRPKSIVATAVLLSVSFQSIHAHASTTIVIDNQLMINKLTSSTFDYRKTALGVSQAKDEIFAAKMKLLPTLNLSTLLSFSSPYFLLSSASCLVPFLFPTNWFNLTSSQKTFDANRLGAEISILNLYATYLTLSYQVAADEKAVVALGEYLKSLEEQFKSDDLSLSWGIISEQDVLRSKLRVGNMKLRIKEVETTLATEKSALKRAFGIEPSDDIKINLPSLSNEGAFDDLTFTRAKEEMLSKALETTQMDLLIKSAKAKRNSSIFSFLTGCSSNQTIGNSSTTTTTGPGTLVPVNEVWSQNLPEVIRNTTSGVSFEIGLGYVANLKIAKDNIRDAELIRESAEDDLVYRLDQTLSAERNYKEAQKLANDQRDISLRLLKQEQTNRNAGSQEADVIKAEQDYTEALIKNEQISAALYGHKITLDRLAMTGDFDVLKKTLDRTLPNRAAKKAKKRAKMN